MFGNHVLRLRSRVAVKLNFRPYIRRYTSPNENFEYSYPLNYTQNYITEPELNIKHTTSNGSNSNELATESPPQSLKVNNMKLNRIVNIFDINSLGPKIIPQRQKSHRLQCIFSFVRKFTDTICQIFCQFLHNFTCLPLTSM